MRGPRRTRRSGARDATGRSGSASGWERSSRRAREGPARAATMPPGSPSGNRSSGRPSSSASSSASSSTPASPAGGRPASGGNAAAGFLLGEPGERPAEFFRQQLRTLLYSRVAGGQKPDATVDPLLERIAGGGGLDGFGV